MKKFRPYLTLPELQEIALALKATSNPNPHLIKFISNFIDEILLSERKECLTLKPPRESFISTLELDDDPENVSIHPTNQHQKLGKICQKTAYLKWTKNPFACSPAELQASQEYRYINTLMTLEEEKKFEEQNGIQF